MFTLSDLIRGEFYSKKLVDLVRDHDPVRESGHLPERRSQPLSRVHPSVLADVVLEPALEANVNVVLEEVGETSLGPSLLSKMLVVVGTLVVGNQVHILTSQQAEQGVQGGSLGIHCSPLAPSFHIDELLVGRNCEKRVGCNIGDDPGFAQYPIDLVFKTVLQSLDRWVPVRLGIFPLIPDTSITSQSKRGREEKEEQPWRSRPALRSPVPWNLHLLSHRPEQGGDGRLQLVAQVVQRLEEVDVGEVEGVAGQAADQDVAQVEED